MTDDQARRLWDRAAALSAPATVLEIGSYHGRSTIILARAASPGVRVLAVDPHAGNDRGPQQWTGTMDEGDADHQAFVANLARAGAADVVQHVRLPSQRAFDAAPEALELLYIDGAHRYRLARDDIDHWGQRVVPGGLMLIHDAFSSIGVTLAILRRLLGSSKFEYRGRVGSLAEYRRVGLDGVSRVRNVARQVRELPWFGRNLVVKVALVTRQNWFARLLGHRSGPWPY